MPDSAPTVRSIKVRGVNAPMPLPLQTSTGALTTAPLVLIDVETSAGVVGRAYLFAFTQASLKPIAGMVEAVGAMITGEPVAPFAIDRRIRQKYTLFGMHNITLQALSGIDMAIWDAHAQQLDAPLVTVLGGSPRPVRAYNSKGLGIMAPGPLAKQAEALVREGFSAVKVRLGRPRGRGRRGRGARGEGRGRAGRDPDV